MTGRISLVEQKRLQWAKEREEMARLNGHWEASKPANIVHPTIRSRMSSRDHQTNSRKPLRACGHYGSTASLRSLETGSTSLRSLDFSNNGSMINILDNRELPEPMRKRSPSLPPIYAKENNHQTYSSQELPSLEVEGSHYTNHPRVQKHSHCEPERNLPTRNIYEEREGETTSGYASDSIEAPVPQAADVKRLLPLGKALGDSEMSERTWQNPYCETPEASLPPSRKFSSTRLGELNRPRWGSIWGQENTRSDPPPLSWLERGLTRLDHSSQVLVINHDSASSPDSSTTGSTGSDSKTYLRGQNIPVDTQILQEREARRQKALELQTAIKQQLEEKDRKRKEERERKLREEREEEERIQRERDIEKQRFDEEQRRLKEKEDAKLKKEEAMREILETAERLAKEKKRQRRQRDNSSDVTKGKDPERLDNWEVKKNNRSPPEVNELPEASTRDAQIKADISMYPELPTKVNTESDTDTNSCKNVEKNIDKENREEPRENLMRLPVNKEVAIVLTGRLEDSDFLNGTNLQLLNLVVNSSPRRENNSSMLRTGISALVKSFASSTYGKSTSGSLSPSTVVENRLLTPSKYRTPSGRDFGTQTDGETEIQELGSKDTCKERKEVVNNCRRDVEKSTSTSMEEKSISRSKSQPRQTLETRPRWNANRPETRYRTQSEKDPHYQRRLRLRRRRVESSDERSRSPSPDRRKSTSIKSKIRNAIHRKSKLDSYDADMSMDSLNSVVPLRIDEHGHINVQMDNKNNKNMQINGNSTQEDNEMTIPMAPKRKLDVWCDQDILSQLASLKNGLLSKQREWDSESCLVSPSTDFY